MVKVGVHVSIAGSIGKAVERAAEAGCDTFQIFSRNPRGWQFRDLSADDIAAFKGNMDKFKIVPPVDHMPYLPNLATPKDDLYARSIMTLSAELKRCGQLDIPYLVTHLGHHLGNGLERGRKRVIDAVNRTHEEVDNDVLILLENTAGERNSVGSTFEDIKAVMDGITDHERIGVCFDTCHAFAAGFDIRTKEGVSETLGKFHDSIGIEFLKIIHLNDSRGECGSGLDRHEHIGMGAIGERGFANILRTSTFRRLPLICETPVDERCDDVGNIKKVRTLAT